MIPKGLSEFIVTRFQTAAWEALTPDKRQALLHPNNSANTLKPLHKASPI